MASKKREDDYSSPQCTYEYASAVLSKTFQ